MAGKGHQPSLPSLLWGFTCLALQVSSPYRKVTLWWVGLVGLSQSWLFLRAAGPVTSLVLTTSSRSSPVWPSQEKTNGAGPHLYSFTGF